MISIGFFPNCNQTGEQNWKFFHLVSPKKQNIIYPVRPNVIKSGLPKLSSENIEVKLESKMHKLDLVESKF